MPLYNIRENMLSRHHLPLLFFVMIITCMWHGLGNTAEQFVCPQLDGPVPEFSLENLNGDPAIVTERIFRGQTTVLQVWSSYCRGCAKEHLLMKELHNPKQFQLIGLDYKDRKKDAKNWLHKYGNIYKVVIFDPEGKFGKSIDVYGTPTTYIIDRDGILRYRYFGLLTREKWNDIIVPELNKLIN